MSLEVILIRNVGGPVDTVNVKLPESGLIQVGLLGKDLTAKFITLPDWHNFTESEQNAILAELKKQRGNRDVWIVPKPSRATPAAPTSPGSGGTQT